MPLTDEAAFGGMTAVLAHEIKNPAALALAHIQLIRAGADDSGKSLLHIENALNTIVDLAQEMLGAAYGQPLAFDFDLQDVLEEVFTMYQAAWPGVRFHLTPGHAPLTIRAREMSVRMVLSNLIKNALEAVSGEGNPYPEVTLCAAAENGCATVTIRDNGPGYSETHGHSKKPRGNGLGLPIARWLLEQMNGELELRSVALGGCEAIVRLALRH
ncbi:MAG: HAMP domain-containing histidine kinase [Defluviitaleaceae bacterium]|nr:HAMP domain-containing histidine kinase [Defluviitaleaceae bacterium]